MVTFKLDIIPTQSELAHLDKRSQELTRRMYFQSVKPGEIIPSKLSLDMEEEINGENSGIKN